MCVWNSIMYGGDHHGCIEIQLWNKPSGNKSTMTTTTTDITHTHTHIIVWYETFCQLSNHQSVHL